MVWVGISLLTRGVVFQWASTIKTGRRSEKHKMGPVHTPHTNTTLFRDQAIELGNPCFSRDKSAKFSPAT